MEEEVVVSLPRNPTQPPPFFPLLSSHLSLSPFNLPSTQLPSASYHGNRRGAENEGRERGERERERSVQPEAKSTKEQHVSAEEGEQICCTSQSVAQVPLKSLMLVYLMQKPKDEFTGTTNYAKRKKAKQITLPCRSCLDGNSVRKSRACLPSLKRKETQLLLSFKSC